MSTIIHTTDNASGAADGIVATWAAIPNGSQGDARGGPWTTASFQAFGTFGAGWLDSPGRLQRWSELGGALADRTHRRGYFRGAGRGGASEVHPAFGHRRGWHDRDHGRRILGRGSAGVLT